MHIKEFGRVRDSELDVLPFVLFSGESGLGKSYMALLCHYFYEVFIDYTRLTNFFKQRNYDYSEMSKDFHNEGVAFTVQKDELEKWLAEDVVSYVGEMLANSSFVGSIMVNLPANIPDKLTFHFKEELTGLVNDEDVDIVLSLHHLSYRVSDSILSDVSPFSFLLCNELKTYIWGDFRRLYKTFVLPPSRGPVLTETLLPQSGVYVKFNQMLSELNRLPNKDNDISSTFFELFHRLIEGETLRTNNRYIYRTPKVEIPISAAAASIREIAPLEMLAKKVDVRTSSILLEEPEAHLHPLKQRLMADLLSAFVNAGCFMQVTTHSDYLLRRLNELIMLDELRSQISDKDYDMFCKEIETLPDLSLGTERIAAYKMECREDGFSRIVRQNLIPEVGIPYSSFSEAIMKSLDTLSKLEKKIELQRESDHVE